MDRRFVKISVIFFFLSSLALAAPFRTTYQAKIIKPDGQPLQSSSVNFRFTILDPSASCALYVEDYTAVNMNDTAGLVAFSLGAGVRSFPSSGTATTFSNTFDNSITSFACQTPGVYLPISTDNRKIVMQFNDGTGWQTLPAMTINAVPYSMYSGKSENSIQLNGKSDTAFVEYSTLAALNCQSNEAIKFNGVSFSCIAVPASGSGGITSVTTSGTVLATGGTASAPVISITAATMSSDGYLTSLDYAEFKAKLSASSTQIITTLGYAPVSASAVAAQINNANLSGDVSGTINSNIVQSVGGKTAAQISTSVDDTSAATASSTADTIVKRNASGNFTANDIYSNAVKTNYVDIYKPSTSFNIRLQASTSLSASYTLNLPATSGAVGQVLSTDGAGNLSWINPSTGSVVSVSAIAPLSSTGGSMPTISITQATSSTHGYLSSTDWNTFNSKQAATSAALIATLGYTPANQSSAMATTSGTENIAYGTNTGSSLTSGSNYNILFGQNAGSALNTGDENIMMGQNAGLSNTGGFGNLFLGSWAGYNNTGDENTFVGSYAGGAYASTSGTGYSNALFGAYAGAYLTNGYQNTMIGYRSGQRTTTGFRNYFGGYESGQDNTEGYHNVFIGYSAGLKNTTANNSVALGANALTWFVAPAYTDAYNTAIGADALYGVATQSSGVRNTALGGKAGNSITTGSDNILIGYDVDTPTPSTSNFINIGNTIYGNSVISNVGIGTTTPTAKLHLAAGTSATASLKFTSGTLLTSPQSGTIEYDGTNFYITDSTNTRRAIAANSNPGTYDNVSSINSSSNITLTPTGSVVVSSTTASTNSSTGALIVKGGLGVTGNINTAGNLNVSGSSVIDGSLKLSSMTSGSVLFAGEGGAITQDNSNFYWDGANKRLGVGLAAPEAKLHVGGSAIVGLNIGANALTINDINTAEWIIATGSYGLSFKNDFDDNGAYDTQLFLNSSGNVGIGTTDPTLGISFSSSNRLLTVEANGVSGSTLSGGLILANGGTLADTYELGHINFVGRQNGVNLDNVMARITSRANGSGGADGFGATLQFFTKPDNTDGGALERMRIDAAGNIGVATTSPLSMVPGWTPNSNQKLLSITGNASASTNANGLLVLANNRATPTGGDQLGAVVFASTNNNGHIPVYVDGLLAGSGGANGFGGILRFHTKPDNVSAPVERVRINSDGNVGIGTGNPIGKLHLVDELNVTPRNLIIDNFTATGGNASQIWGRTARGTAQSPTATQAGDPLLNLIGASYDGSSFNEVGHVRVLAESNQSTSVRDSFIEFTTTTGTSLAERMRITSTGNVGIGTASPSGKLNVVGDWNGSYGAVTLQGDKPTIRFSSTSGTIGGGNHWLIHQGNSDPSNVGSLDFFQSTDGATWGTAKLKIAPNGNVGIGTTTPREQLATTSNVKVGTGSGASSNFVQITGHHENSVTGGYGSGFRLQFNSSSDLFMISREWSGWNNDPNFVIARSSGNVGIGTGSPSYKLDVSGTIRGFGITDSSDIRLKKDIAPLEFSLEKLLQIKGVSYHWKDRTMPKKQIGFIAQDLEKIYPELVETDQSGMKSVNYSHLVAPLVESVKSLYEKVMVLFDRNEQLSREVAAVKAENAEKTRQLNDIRAYLCSKDLNAPMCK